jgi:membrane protein
MLSKASGLLRDALRSYSRHGGRMLAAAVAFSSLLSIAPMLLIALRVAALTVGDDRGRAGVRDDLARWVGEDGAATIFALLDRAVVRDASAGVVGAVLLAYGATRLFSQLKRALNQMWGVQARSGGGFRGTAWKQLRKRALSLAMVLFVGGVVVAVVMAKAVLAAATQRLGDAGARVAWRLGETLLSLAATTLLFGAIFKALPDARIAWRDAWRGALVTATLFSAGAALIGLYLGGKAFDAMYGAAGSLVMLLLWVHYSAQVFFFGAAVTGELARRSGRTIAPDENGVRVRTEE